MHVSNEKGTIAAVNMTSSRYHALDGLRGVAAVVVVERHCRHWFGDWSFSSGYLAVDFFFLLSGFVLAMAYDYRLAQGFSSGRFISLRFLRLFPLYGIGVALTSWVMALDGELYIIDVILALLFIPRLGLANPNWLVGPAWSLSMELFVNCAYSLCHRYILGITLYITILISGLSLCILSFKYKLLDIGYEMSSISGGFARVMFSFFCGVFLYRASALLPKFSRGGWMAVALFVALLSVPVSAELRPFFDTIIVVVGMPAVIVLAAHAVPSAASRWWFRILGEMSYSLYAIHWGAIKITDHYWQVVYGSGTHPTGIIGMSFIGFFGLTAVALARFVDAPFQKAVQTLMKRQIT